MLHAGDGGVPVLTDAGAPGKVDAATRGTRRPRVECCVGGRPGTIGSPRVYGLRRRPARTPAQRGVNESVTCMIVQKGNASRLTSTYMPRWSGSLPKP